MDSRSHSISFMAAALLHVVLAVLLLISFEKTIFIPAELPDPDKPIIHATMVNQRTLQDEVSRLNVIEEKKRQAENEAKQKRLHEEALAIELKKKNEQLKKEAQEQKLAQLREEQALLAKLKAEKEELKKLEKEKQAALAQKQKQEEQKKIEEKKAEEKKILEQKMAELKKQKALELEKEKAAQESEQNAAALKVKQDELMRYAMMIRNKIHQHWRQPVGFDFSGYKCKIQVKLLPTGEVIDAMVVESSSNVEYDRSAELAIRKASPLPIPEDPALAKEFRQFTFSFHPEDV